MITFHSPLLAELNNNAAKMQPFEKTPKLKSTKFWRQNQIGVTYLPLKLQVSLDELQSDIDEY